MKFVPYLFLLVALPALASQIVEGQIRMPEQKPVQNSLQLQPAYTLAASAPAASAPAVSAPAASAPAASAPAVSAPAVSAPAVSAPAVSAPAVSAPAVSAPAVSAPAVSAPAVSAPAVSAPAVSAPAVSAPISKPPQAVASPSRPVHQPNRRASLAAVAPPSSDGDFLAAYAAFRVGDAAKLDRYAQRLKKTALEVYVSYYQLRLDLEKTDPQAIRSFLARPEDSPVIDRLRSEWLKQLGKNQQWDLFDAEYPHLINDDTELTCYALQSRRRSHEVAALRNARTLWFNGKEQPESCLPLFDSAIAAGIITQHDIWQRLQLTLETNNVSLAKQLAERLNGTYAISATALKRAAEDPDRYLENLALDSSSLGQRTVVLFALQRLARQSPDLAIQRWEKLAANFPEAEQKYFYGWLAYAAARKQDTRALQWFQAAGNAPLNDEQAEWHVRAALRIQDWPAVLKAINALNGNQRREAAWRYWKARALLAEGQPARAMKLLQPLSKQYNFYGQLAGEELDDLLTANKGKTASQARTRMKRRYRPDKRQIASMLVLPGIQRTLALYRMDMLGDARREWNWTVRNFNDKELLTAAEIARRNEMYDRAIVAAERTVSLHDFSLRYLAPYRKALQQHIRENELDEAWVYGLMRQESRFVTAAKSHVGASGLMQIMPATARWVARKMGLKNYRQSLLHQLDTNLRLGTYYMKTVLGWFDNNPVLASAAYNAGPGRARRWRGEQALEGAIYAETIPFNETRNYVKKVMSNTEYYSRQFGMPPQTLKQRMGIIEGKTATNQQAIPDEK